MVDDGEQALLRWCAERFAAEFGRSWVAVRRGWPGDPAAIAEVSVAPPGAPGRWRVWVVPASPAVGRPLRAGAFGVEAIPAPVWAALRRVDRAGGGELRRAFGRSRDPRGRRAAELLTA